MRTPAMAPVSLMVICIATATARFVWPETFSLGRLVVWLLFKVVRQKISWKPTLIAESFLYIYLENNKAYIPVFVVIKMKKVDERVSHVLAIVGCILTQNSDWCGYDDELDSNLITSGKPYSAPDRQSGRGIGWNSHARIQATVSKDYILKYGSATHSWAFHVAKLRPVMIVGWFDWSERFLVNIGMS